MNEQIEAERLAQRVLQLLSRPLATEEVAEALGMGNVETLVLLRDTMRGRVVDVTDFADRDAGRRMWVSGEVPLP